MKKIFARGDKVLFNWLGTNKIGIVDTKYRKVKSNNSVYYEYDITGEDDKLYERIPLMSSNDKNFGINYKLTNKIFKKNGE